MKLKIHMLLPILYSLYTSSMFIKILCTNPRINTLTVLVYFGNILITYVIYKVGRIIENWLNLYY